MANRLLFITPLFPKNDDFDYVVPFVTDFSNHFADETDVKIDVISLMYPFTSKKYEYGKLTVYPIGSKFKNKISLLPYLLLAVAKGIALCRKKEYDGILCFWYRESALIGRILSKLFKIKQIVWMHGQDINKDNKYVNLLKIPASQLIMVSEQQRNFFQENHGIYIEKIANVAINRNSFPELNNSARSIDILGVGNLSALKNYSLFIDIVADLKKEFPVIRVLHFGGDSGEKQTLTHKINDLKLDSNIVLKGTISHKEVLDNMNNAKVFLHTSKSEGGGTVLHEALYSGCHVVSTIAIEEDETTDTFYFNTEKQKLVERIRLVLNHPKPSKRVERFRMEDSVDLIYRCFY